MTMRLPALFREVLILAVSIFTPFYEIIGTVL